MGVRCGPQAWPEPPVQWQRQGFVALGLGFQEFKPTLVIIANADDVLAAHSLFPMVLVSKFPDRHFEIAPLLNQLCGKDLTKVA